MIIYQALNLINGKSYIGKTKEKTFKKRKQDHLRKSKEESPSSIFHRAIKKYSEDAWEWRILAETDDLERLNELEKELIKEYRTFTGFKDCCGYNMTLGGDGGDNLSTHPRKEEIIALKIKNSSKENHFLNKMSEEERENFLNLYRRKENHPQFGKPKNEVQLCASRQVGLSNKGKKYTKKRNPLSLEVRKKMSASHKGLFKGENNPNYGKKGKHNHSSKPLVMIFPDGKEVLTLCITDFTEEYLLCRTHIRNVQRGKLKQHKGFKAREYDPNVDTNIELWTPKVER